MAIQSGLDQAVLTKFSQFNGKRLGVLCHPASVDRDYVHILDRMAAAKLDIRAVFGPEHGFSGHAQDMIGVGTEKHPVLGCPIYSLYGATADSLTPKVEWLKGLDVVVIDLQDIGSRYYTFVWTAVLMMRVAAQAGVRVVVLDRPNPLGAQREGGGVDSGFTSFVGLYDVPVRHGITLGRMLQLVRHEERLNVQLDIVAPLGWSGNRVTDGYAWVYPSPNMPTYDTALVYPGMCLLEATNASEGRGTTRPFEVIGAEYVHAEQFAAALTALGEPGIRYRPLTFTPTFHKFAGSLCGGVQLHVTDAAVFRPFRMGVRLVRVLATLYPQAFAWRKEPYEFIDNVNAFDLLTGCSAYREAFASDSKLCEVYDSREARVGKFEERVGAIG